MDHRPALFLADGHGLFAQYMNACARRANAVIGVQMVWQSNINGIDFAAAQAIVVFSVRVMMIDPITPPESFELLRIVGNQRCELGIGPRMRERRQHGDLSDMSQADDRITYFATLFLTSHISFPPYGVYNLRQS